MKKFLYVLAMLAMSIAFVSAEEGHYMYMEDAAGNMDERTYETFCFLTGVDALAQNKAQGGLIAFTEDYEYLAGWATDDTPGDFFLSMPPSTLSVAQVVPVLVAQGLFLNCSYTGANPILEEYGKTHDYVMVVVCFKLYDSIVLEDMVYYKAKEALEGTVTANGLEISEFYALYESKGKTEEELVNRVLEGESSSEIVFEALAIRQSTQEVVRKGNIPWLVIFGAVIFAIAVFLCSLWAKAREMSKKEE